MLREEDIKQIEERGSKPDKVLEQIGHFKQGFPFLQVAHAATVGNGIIKLTKEETEHFGKLYRDKIGEGLHVVKFVPASGAASRMFKALFTAKENLENGQNTDTVLQDKAIREFFNQLEEFAFYPDIDRFAEKKDRAVGDLSALEVLDFVLTESGLNYGNLPKGLLKFHHYPDGARTPFEEHCYEGALYAQCHDNSVYLHFTVSPEHQNLFSAHLSEITGKLNSKFQNMQMKVSFSQQKPSTDTIAVDLENEPFREADGRLHFRPGGHGALLDNLNDLLGDLIFIKNIDNVVPDALKPDTIIYKQALAGVLLNIQEKIFYYQEKLNQYHYSALTSAFYAEAGNFLENVLHVVPAQHQYYTEKEELYHYLKKKFDRPIRVCGMVKNEGEPGGGPFWAKNSDGTISLQIVESAQIDPKDADQKNIFNQSTHFNPVDLVCAIKNHKGEKYDLMQFSDPETGFIANKSKDGKELKAQELPGLWNGAMADWNTLFVEVPITTFNPVKTVNDLLRKEHQPG